MTRYLHTGNVDLKYFLLHELCLFPPAMFNEYGMLDPKKSRFADKFNSSDKIPDVNVSNVLDGGFLLHKVVWKPQDLDKIINYYVRYIKRHYSGGSVSVVFDGYPEDCSNSTKFYVRVRRGTKNVGVEVQLSRDTPVNDKQSTFLSNEKKKTRLIQILAQELQKENMHVLIAEEDADVLLVQTALDLAKSDEMKNVIVVGEDVDLLVIMNQVATAQTNLYLLKPKSSSAATGKSTVDRIYNSSCFKNPELQSHVAFMHAFSGCDTTAPMFKQGKSKLSKIMSQFNELRELAEYSKNKAADRDVIVDSGCKIVACMYEGDLGRELEEVRFSHYEKMLGSKSFSLKTLPPTQGTIEQHSLRVYYQVQKWLRNDLNPLEWGWERWENQDKARGIRPTLITDKKYLMAEEILKTIYCSCKTGCTNNTCSCREVGLNCSSLCRMCRGCDCSNSVVLHDRDFSNDPENDDHSSQRMNDMDETIEHVIQMCDSVDLNEGKVDDLEDNTEEVCNDIEMIQTNPTPGCTALNLGINEMVDDEDEDMAVNPEELNKGDDDCDDDDYSTASKRLRLF
ncbi:hypothetical protein QAD02_008296 [Eretmocerus hayati]|uniref:Uncharacterized protein n=1 Tax=Eretmocerus hayati TaxID=131215 RepID=A0ACC2N8G0_9HYME|nr:hypothetical protein QAD02_008296 [Eretmocerus hayati]